MSEFSKELKEDLEEALAYSKGQITLKSEFIEIPKLQRIQALEYGLKSVNSKKT